MEISKDSECKKQYQDISLHDIIEVPSRNRTPSPFIFDDDIDVGGGADSYLSQLYTGTDISNTHTV